MRALVVRAVLLREYFDMTRVINGVEVFTVQEKNDRFVGVEKVLTFFFSCFFPLHLSRETCVQE